MQRTVKAFGVEFDTEYEWDDKALELLAITIGGSNLTELLAESVVEEIKSSLYGFYGEDQADRADYLYELSREAV